MTKIQGTVAHSRIRQMKSHPDLQQARAITQQLVAVVLLERSCISQVPEQATNMVQAPVAMEKDIQAEKALEDLGRNQATVLNPVKVEKARGVPEAIHRNPAAIIVQKGITEHDGH
ncbi:hypothetical protein DPMN_065448 [Dreissena polymorpha]|uniref:Uncharacterized protein n=1 Tax=Dreissena polymorpha TaxID=45954 RepID=A0A9D4BS34_DREPO|nr:hypothetical protein DPMN_065448 [Dreissena polymorpha]